MKKILFIVLFSLMTFICNATDFDIDIYIENDSTFLIAMLETDANKYVMQQNPKMQIRLINDNIIILNGQLIQKLQSSSEGIGITNYIPIFNMIISTHEYDNSFISVAKFYITENQIQQISSSLGFKSIRLNTIPNYYEKKYHNKKYDGGYYSKALYLYKKYKKLKSQENNF